MGGELRDKVASGVAWSLGEKLGTILLQMVVSIVVARLLMPDDVGLMALMTFFSSLALVVVDSGFSQMLIRKGDPAQGDYKSVFLFNVVVSWIVYGVLVAVFPAVAAFYGRPILARIAPVLFLLVPVNALGTIQNTIFMRQFRFALLSKITFVASLASGVLAVTMARAGCGVWSLVGQRLSSIAVRALLLWFFSDWRPRRTERASTRPLREMAPYSLRLMATDLISAIYTRVAQLFIGKIYSTDLLGYFYQAQKLEELPVTSTVQSVQNVTFPAFSKLAASPRKFAESYRQVVMIVAFLMFPAMTGLSAVAPDLFALLLGERWMPTVPYFEAMCLVGLFTPLAMIAYNVLKTLSDGRVVVRLEVVKRVLMTGVLAVTIPHSVMAIVWGMVAMAAIELVLNLGATTRLCTLSLWRFVRTLLPIAAVTALMYGTVVWGVQPRIADLHLGLRLMVQLIAGVAVFAGAAALFRLESLRETLAIVRKLWHKTC